MFYLFLFNHMDFFYKGQFVPPVQCCLLKMWKHLSFLTCLLLSPLIYINLSQHNFLNRNYFCSLWFFSARERGYVVLFTDLMFLNRTIIFCIWLNLLNIIVSSLCKLFPLPKSLTSSINLLQLTGCIIYTSGHLILCKLIFKAYVKS